MKDTTLLKRCLDVLNLEAEYSDHFKRPANRCPAWYELRAELRDRLGEELDKPTETKQQMKTTTLIESPKLAIQSSEDGVWLMFSTADGKHANINLPTFFGEGRSMNDSTICQWAKEYVLASVEKRDEEVSPTVIEENDIFRALIRTAVAALNDYPMSQDAQMGLLVALAKAIDDPILHNH